MENDNWIHAVIQGLFFPPGLIIVLVFIGLSLWKRWRIVSISFHTLALTILLTLSLPVTSRSIQDALKIYDTFDYRSITFPETSAILLLGAGDARTAPEMGNIDTIGSKSLERTRYAAFLFSKLEVPVFVSGGRRKGQASPESVLINQVLIDEFGVTPQWLESKSASVEKQAELSGQLMRSKNVSHVIVVAHEEELYTAVTELTSQGFKTFPAPILPPRAAQLPSYQLWLPSYHALFQSCEGLKQLILRLWYWA